MDNGNLSPKINELRERLAESVRICVREELLESFGHVSARDPESKRIFVLRHLHERLDRVTAQDFIEVDEAGRPVGGKVEPPKEVFLHTAIYCKRQDINAVVYSHPLYSTILGVLGKQILPLLANCTFIKSGIRLFDVPRFIGTSEMAELMISELGSSVALLLRGSGLVTVAENIQEATLLSILIEKSAKVQYMASAIGEPKPIVPDDMPGKLAPCQRTSSNRPGDTTYPSPGAERQAAPRVGQEPQSHRILLTDFKTASVSFFMIV
jgi:ribulose-5-phosphate 4-epimerase/fuculose-1-phosphate aldolase